MKAVINNIGEFSETKHYYLLGKNDSMQLDADNHEEANRLSTYADLGSLSVIRSVMAISLLGW